MTDPDEELRSWVNWLIERHELWRKIPPCWERHQGIADELNTLWMALGAVEATLAEDPRPLVSWFDSLQQFLARLADRPASRCLRTGHKVPDRWPEA